MQTCLPPWPAGFPRVFKPMAKVQHDPRMGPDEVMDLIALGYARRVRARSQDLRCSGTTGTWTECMWANRGDFAAFNTSASEGSILVAGPNDQPVFPALYFLGKQGVGRVVSILARGVLGTTSTPTIIFQNRLGTTSGSSFLSGTSVGVSAAITTASGVSNKWWEMRLDLVCYTAGIGTGNTTLSGAGYVSSPGGFASPFLYALEPTTPDTATWTATIDCALTQYYNLSVTWSSSSSSNTITLKQLVVSGLN